MHVVLVDSDDSFTYNLVHALARKGVSVEVVAARRGQHVQADLVVLGPGPGRPEDRGLDELASRLLGRTPLFGVCLGHQALVLATGGSIVRAEPVHGFATPVRHNGKGLFRGLQDPVAFGRYHSLVAEPAADGALDVLARTDDGLVMAVQHVAAPAWGVQFHPESVLSGAAGRKLLRNLFLSVRDAHSGAQVC